MLSSNTSAVSGDANYIEDVFSTYLYTGNGGTQTITNNIDLSTKGGLVWIKSRTSGTANNVLYDTARGATQGLYSNTTAAQVTRGAGLTAFTSSGFTLGSSAYENNSGDAIVSWTFRKQPKFFDVVTYTGTGVARTIAHNLGSVPGCIITKCTSGVNNWYTYHRSLGNTNEIRLNQTAAAASGSLWNSTDPTSTVFSLGASSDVNSSGDTYVAYLFAHNAGGFGLTGTDNVISCGSVTDDGSGNGVFANLGWEPQWVLVKRSNGVENWAIADSMRGMAAVSVADNSNGLIPNTSGAEALTAITGRISATGWTSPTGRSAGQTFIYIAIRRGPMKVPTDATKVFAPVATTFAVTTTATTNFPVDLVINTQRTKVTVTQNITRDRLRGEVYSTTTGTAAEAATNVTGEFASNTSYIDKYTQPAYGSGITGTNAIYWAFQRAPSFFDEVCYTGTQLANTNINHNLSVAPELVITKKRESAASGDWYVYSASLGNDKYLRLNATSASTTSTTAWSATTPTASVFTVGANAVTNGSANFYLAYLFATCAGVSKVGSYTGTGTTKQVDCGFAAGARFVLIKRTDSTGDWYTWDTARGIVSGNDPYLLLNSTAAEATTTDYIDTYSAGFELSSTAPAALNASGGTYIFLAIA